MQVSNGAPRSIDLAYERTDTVNTTARAPLAPNAHGDSVARHALRQIIEADDAQVLSQQLIEIGRAVLEQPNPPAAWRHEEDPDRVISASQKEQALRDGGASASSVRAYTIPLRP